MKIKVIIFDLDNTLYDEKDFIKSGFKAVAEYMERESHLNKKEFLKTLIRIREKEGSSPTFDIAFKNYNLYNKKLSKKLVTIYRSHNPDIKPFSGAKNLLKILNKKYKLALITDGLGYVQKNKVKTLGIEDFFDLIIYTGFYGSDKSKPNTFAFKKILQHFNVSPEEVMAVGDNPKKDFLGAKILGIKTIRIMAGEHKDLEINADLAADYQIKSINEVLKIINYETA